MLSKEVRFYSTKNVNAEFGKLQMALFITLILDLIQQHPFDMFIFEMGGNGCFQIRLSGYNLNTGELDESTIIYRNKSLPIRKFWLKIDDYGDKYIGTFLFPEEY